MSTIVSVGNFLPEDAWKQALVDRSVRELMARLVQERGLKVVHALNTSPQDASGKRGEVRVAEENVYL